METKKEFRISCRLRDRIRENLGLVAPTYRKVNNQTHLTGQHVAVPASTSLERSKECLTQMYTDLTTLTQVDKEPRYVNRSYKLRITTEIFGCTGWLGIKNGVVHFSIGGANSISDQYECHLVFINGKDMTEMGAKDDLKQYLLPWLKEILSHPITDENIWFHQESDFTDSRWDA